MNITTSISHCGIFISGPSYWHTPFRLREREPEGWSYPEHMVIQHQGEEQERPEHQLVIGVTDTNQLALLKDLYEQLRSKEFKFWLTVLAPAISNVHIYYDAPEDLKLAALNLPGIERLALQDPEPTLLFAVERLPIFHTLDLYMDEECHHDEAKEMAISLSKAKVTHISISCRVRSDIMRCGFLSLLMSISYDSDSIYSKITDISCCHITKAPFISLLSSITNLRRLRVFRYSEVENMLPVLHPPLEVELRDEVSNADTAAGIGAAVTVFENSLFELSREQIRNLQACINMKDITFFMQEGQDWEYVSTLKKMPKLERLRVCGDDSSEDLRDPVIRAIPSAMWMCVKVCPRLSKLVFNTILISSEEIDMIMRTVGQRLESFIYGIFKQENNPEEKFVDIMTSAGKHCGGSNSRLRFLGIPPPREMNMWKGDIMAIPQSRKIAFHNAANFVTSRCPHLPIQCLNKVWEVILAHERKVEAPGAPQVMSPVPTHMNDPSDHMQE